MQASCNVCAESLAPDFPRVGDPLTNEVFAIYRCPRCGLGNTLPQPEDLGRYYAAHYYGNRHGFTVRHCMKRRLGFVSAALKTGSEKRRRDVGCGDGSFLLTARESGWEVFGTELNPQAARARGLEVKESVSQIPAGMQFDCITMWHTLEHMRDIPSLLADLRGLLKPEGRLIIAVPNYGGFQARIFGAHWLHLDVPRHLYHFNAQALDYSLRKAGFTPERQWHQEFEYDLLGWSQSALNVLLPYPNLFFNALTGKKSPVSPVVNLTGFLLGSILTVLSLPFLVAGTLLRQGGTLVTVARRTP
jgi:SAM-dependent methyltransferase